MNNEIKLRQNNIFVNGNNNNQGIRMTLLTNGKAISFLYNNDDDITFTEKAPNNNIIEDGNYFCFLVLDSSEYGRFNASTIDDDSISKVYPDYILALHNYDVKIKGIPVDEIETEDRFVGRLNRDEIYDTINDKGYCCYPHCIYYPNAYERDVREDGRIMNFSQEWDSIWDYIPLNKTNRNNLRDCPASKIIDVYYDNILSAFKSCLFDCVVDQLAVKLKLTNDQKEQLDELCNNNDNDYNCKDIINNAVDALVWKKHWNNHQWGHEYYTAFKNFIRENSGNAFSNFGTLLRSEPSTYFKDNMLNSINRLAVEICSEKELRNDIKEILKRKNIEHDDNDQSSSGCSIF